MSKRIYTLNENYFEQIDTQEKAYFLGFLYADGYNHHSKGEVIITQVEQDKDIIYELQNRINSNCPIKIRVKDNPNHQDAYELTIYSRKVSDDLNKLGVTQGKTHTTSFPDISEEFYYSFIRGYFDGDGSISINPNEYDRLNITFTGNDLLINRIRDIINKNEDVVGSVNCRHKETPNIITLNYCGTKSCISILNKIFENSTLHSLRKYTKYIEAKRKFNINTKFKDNRAKTKKELKNSKIEEANRIEQEENEFVKSKIDQGYSMRHIGIQFGMDKRKVKRIIDRCGYEYPERRRMFAKDPGKSHF